MLDLSFKRTKSVNVRGGGNIIKCIFLVVHGIVLKITKINYFV